ncbi:hypothetical protein FF38_05532 [Lucilia cuprina]|uniref:Uncharacterized protein n=1 Tax=Lucilia cuprina TaxID=7375 RepID=A0A0L0BVN7_LUCCU|nr:hypothetical protein FF38_05532 [Lucilia cuprina]
MVRPILTYGCAIWFNISSSRIDNFIIKLIRNHILKCTECTTNNLIFAPYYTDDQYILNTLISGHVPPEAFIHLD